MVEKHQLNNGPVVSLVVPERYQERRNLEIAFRRGFAAALYASGGSEYGGLGNKYLTAGLHNAWQAGFDDCGRQIAEASK